MLKNIIKYQNLHSHKNSKPNELIFKKINYIEYEKLPDKITIMFINTKII